MISRKCVSGPFGRLCLTLMVSAFALPASAEVDSEHMFGFTTGSDMGPAGEIEGEVETDSAGGRRAGRYFASAPSLQLKYTVIENVRIAPHLEFGRHTIFNQPDIFDINRFQFSGGGMEFKYRALNRTHAPFGATFAVDFSANRIDPGTGQRARDQAIDFNASFDKELLHDRLFGALNIDYGMGWTRDHATQILERSSTFGIGGALSARIAPNAFIGGEIRHLRAYDGIGLSQFAGEALFAGPTAYLLLAPNANITLAWNVQIAGHDNGGTGRLDLTNFERHQVRVRLGVGF